MVMLPMASSCLAAVHADGKAAGTLHPMPIQKLAARRSCMQAQERSSLRGLTRTDCTSLARPSQDGSKKGAQVPPLSTTLLAPDPEEPTSTTQELDERMARLCSTKRTTPGCGWPCAAKRGRWSPIRWVIGANGHASGCGKRFRRGIDRDNAKRLSGPPTRR
jgi:hypothetical protein